MKTNIICVGFCLIIVNLLVTVLAYPHDHAARLNQPLKTDIISRSRRSLSGAYDALVNGFEGFMSGVKKVGKSAVQAIEKVFTEENWTSLAEGFSKFKKGFKDAAGSLFGGDGSIKQGWQTMKDKFSRAFNGDEEQSTSRPVRSEDFEYVPPTKTVPGEKGYVPSGSVPKEETT